MSKLIVITIKVEPTLLAEMDAYVKRARKRCKTFNRSKLLRRGAYLSMSLAA